MIRHPAVLTARHTFKVKGSKTMNTFRVDALAYLGPQYGGEKCRVRLPEAFVRQIVWSKPVKPWRRSSGKLLTVPSSATFSARSYEHAIAIVAGMSGLTPNEGSPTLGNEKGYYLLVRPEDGRDWETPRRVQPITPSRAAVVAAAFEHGIIV